MVEQKSLSYQDKQRTAYAGHAELVAREIINSVSFLHFGPVYNIEALGRESVKVYTMFTREPEDFAYSHYYLISTNSGGEVIGDRMSVVHNNFTVDGIIYVRQRNKGIAIQMELVHRHLLQWESDNQQETVVGRADNINKLRLDLILKQKERITELPEQQKELLLVEAHEALIEQQRWQTLFGENGKLGYVGNGRTSLTRLVLKPRKRKDVLEQEAIEEIDMERVDVVKNKRVLSTGRVKRVKFAEDIDKSQALKREHFFRLIFPQLQSLAA